MKITSRLTSLQLASSQCENAQPSSLSLASTEAEQGRIIHIPRLVK